MTQRDRSWWSIPLDGTPSIRVIYDLPVDGKNLPRSERIN